MNSQSTEKAELELEHRLKIPAPLDPHVASISMRTGSNNPSDHFDLLLSASFGSEYVVLESGEDTIEVKISIQKAEVKFDSINCSLVLVGVEGAAGEGWHGSEKRTSLTSTSKQGNASISAGLGKTIANAIGVEGKGDIKGEAKSDLASSAVVERNMVPYRIISSDTVQIGYADDFSTSIHGRIIDENIGIRVSPVDHGKKVGVLSRIRVRERWIKIEEASPIKATARLSAFLSGLKKDGEEERRRRELFSRLIAHLIAIELQDSTDEKNATLCAAAVVLSPVNHAFNGLSGPAQRAQIRIDPSTIESFLQAEVGDEVRVLSELGVDVSQYSDKITLNEQYQNMWYDFSFHNSVYFDKSISFNMLWSAFSSSFGCDVVFVKPNADILDDPKSVFLRHEDALRKSAAAILDDFSEFWRSEGILIELGILARGEWAWKIAVLLGFPFTYQTLQKRMKPYSVRTGYGYLISIGDLFRAIGAGDRLKELRGAELRFPELLRVNTTRHATSPLDQSSLFDKEDLKPSTD